MGCNRRLSHYVAFVEHQHGVVRRDTGDLDKLDAFVNPRACLTVEMGSPESNVAALKDATRPAAVDSHFAISNWDNFISPVAIRLLDEEQNRAPLVCPVSRYWDRLSHISFRVSKDVGGIDEVKIARGDRNGVCL